MATFDVSEQGRQPVVTIRTRTNIGSLPALIGESYMKIMGYLGELAEAPSGAPYTAYHNMDMQDLDVEMGFPTAKLLPGRGEITASEIPSGKVVATMHKGPYAAMEKTYNELFQWIAAQGLEQIGACYEYYYNSPQEVPESELLTRIVIPIKG